MYCCRAVDKSNKFYVILDQDLWIRLGITGSANERCHCRDHDEGDQFKLTHIWKKAEEKIHINFEITREHDI